MRHGAHPDVLDFPIDSRPVRHGVRLRGRRSRTSPASRPGSPVFLTGSGAVPAQGRDFLEDDRRHGRRRHRADLPGAAATRRRIRVLPPPRRAASGRRRQAVDAITMGRQVELADGSTLRAADHSRGLPVFPDRPLADQIAARDPDSTRPGVALRQSGRRRDPGAAPRCRLRPRGARGVARHGRVVAGELIDDRPEWREMTDHVRTVATQAFQFWLRPDEPTLGWDRRASPPAATSTVRHLGVDATDAVGRGLARRRPAAAPSATSAAASTRHGRRTRSAGDYVARLPSNGSTPTAAEYLDRHLGLYLPGAVTERRFDWACFAAPTARRVPPRWPPSTSA